MGGIGGKQGSGVERDRGPEGLQVLLLNVDRFPIGIFWFPITLSLVSNFGAKSLSFSVYDLNV